MKCLRCRVASIAFPFLSAVLLCSCVCFLLKIVDSSRIKYDNCLGSKLADKCNEKRDGRDYRSSRYVAIGRSASNSRMLAAIIKRTTLHRAIESGRFGKAPCEMGSDGRGE